MSSIIVETVDGGAVYFVKHCPKCGGELDIEQECIDCTYSEDTSLSAEEAREFTLAGD
jgi:hypothetical protein